MSVLTRNEILKEIGNRIKIEQVLEISNSGSIPLRIHTGVRICHVVFQKTLGGAKYKGKFSRQIHV